MPDSMDREALQQQLHQGPALPAVSAGEGPARLWALPAVHTLQVSFWGGCAR